MENFRYLEDKDKEKYTLSLFLFCFGVILFYIDFLRNAFDIFGQIFPQPIRIFLIVSGPLIMFISVFTCIWEGQLDKLCSHYRNWLVFLLITFFLLLVMGVFVFRNDFRMILLDFLYLPGIFAGILIGSKKKNWTVIDKLIYSLFLANIIGCLIYIRELIGLGFSLRHEIIVAFNNTPYFFWGALNLWPYFVLTMKNKSNFRKFVTIFGTILFFLLAIFYQKRAPFIELIVFILLISIKIKIGQFFKIALIIFLTSLTFLEIFSILVGPEKQKYFLALENRFNKHEVGILQTLKEEDRLRYDPFLVFNQFSGLEFAAGRGLGGVVIDVKNYYPENVTNVLHNGSAFLLLKGGFLLLVLWTAGWLMVLKDFIMNKNFSFNSFYIPILTIFLLSWVTGFLSKNLAFLLLMMCSGRIMSKEIAGNIPKLALLNKAQYKNI